MADQGSQGLLSPILRNARMSAARKWLKGNVLDVGCGSGSLAALVDASNYTGFDQDKASIEKAMRNFPSHRFQTTLPDSGRYDTIVALALIEHLSDPVEEVLKWSERLADGGKIVMTTPHKSFRMVHDVGAKVGIFSADAADEHEEMFNRSSLYELAQRSGLTVVNYNRFLFGANQLLVVSKPQVH